MKSLKNYVNVIGMKRIFCVFCACISIANAESVTALKNADNGTFGLLVDGNLIGSGFIVDPSGYAFTAAHQVAGETRTLHAQSHVLGRVGLDIIALDRGRDIALLKLEDRIAPYPFLRLAPNQVSLGKPIQLIATANYRHNLLIHGRVARTQLGFEYFPELGHYVPITYLAAMVQTGTSGGAWLNTTGRVVGMQVGLMHSGTGRQPAPVGVAYMVPVDYLKTVLNHRATIRRSSLRIGVEELWERDAHSRRHLPSGATGLFVARISMASRAYRAGLRQGHVITEMDSKPISYRENFLTLIRQKQVTEQVSLTVIGRNQQTQTIVVSLEDI